MIQEAILFTRNNADVIVANLSDYTVEELLEDYGYMLDSHGTVVLARSYFEDEDEAPVDAMLSYVVHKSYFDVNCPGIELNDKTFVEVRRF